MDISKHFESFLKRNNISHVIKNNTISFSFEGKNYLLILDSQDPHYYRLTLPKVNDSYVDSNERDRLLILLSSEIKVAKIIDTKTDGIWFSYEQLLMSENDSDCDYVFARSIRILSVMLDRYRTMIQERTQNILNETEVTPIVTND